jgi:nucleoside-diphosphate-sugar epimerase
MGGKLYFSSSCTLFTVKPKKPITEDASIQKRCLLGNTKQIGEEIITDVAKVSHINAILLRYFNPIEHILPLKWRITYWSTSKLSPLLRRLGLDYERALCLRR